MRHLFTELFFCCPPPCVEQLLVSWFCLCIFLHYPKQHVFDVAIKRLSHAVSQQGFLLTGEKSKYFCISSCLKIVCLKIKH